MPQQHQDDSTLQRFVVGEVSDEEREQIEALLLEDDDLFERCEAIEAEVLAKHAAGELVAHERERVTVLTLASPEIGLRRELLGHLLSLARAERTRRLAYAAIAATILVALGIGWVLSTKPQKLPVEIRNPARHEMPQEASERPPVPPVQEA